MSLFPLDLMSSVSQTKCVCRSWAAGLLWEMMELAWQEFQETLVWSHSVRCSIHGHEQPLVWRIYNHDAAAVPVFIFALIISSDALFIVNLTLLHTCQCFSLIAKLQSIALQILNSFLLKSGSRRECTKEWELVRCPVWGGEMEQLPAAGKENLVTKFFEDFTLLPFMETWLSEEVKQK